MSSQTIPLSKLMIQGQKSLDPRKTPSEIYELFSIPAYDNGQPDNALGSEIGSSKKIVKAGDLLLSRIVPHIRRAWVVPKSNGKSQIASGEWIVFRHSSMEPRYLRHLVMGDTFHAKFMNTVAGVGGSLVRARPENVGRIEIFLPPLSEQKRIADILDKADAIRRKRQEILDELAGLRTSQFYSMFGDPSSNKMGWTTRSVGECLEDGILLGVQDGNHGNDHPKVSEFQSTGVPFVAANRLTNNRLDLESCPHLSEERTTQLRIGFSRPGDVLLTHKASLGFTCVVPDSIELVMLTPQVTYYRCDSDRLNPHFLSGYFRTPYFQSLLRQHGQQSTRAYLGITRQKRLPLMIPDIELQNRYATFLTTHECTTSRQQTACQELAELCNSLVQRAFKGEL